MDANEKDPAMLKASADRDAAYDLPDSDPTKNDKIDAAEEAYYVIQDKLTAKVNADPKVKVAKEAVKAARVETPDEPRTQSKSAASSLLKTIAAGVSPITEEPSFETMPEPVREPSLKSLASIFFPLMAQKRVVPGVTFLVSTVVVKVSPSLTEVVEGLRL